jgi:hypothetical protein
MRKFSRKSDKQFKITNYRKGSRVKRRKSKRKGVLKKRKTPLSPLERKFLNKIVKFHTKDLLKNRENSNGPKLLTKKEKEELLTSPRYLYPLKYIDKKV